MKYTFTAVVVKRGKFYVAHCPELGVASQGESRDESLANLKEAVHLFLEDADVTSLSLQGERPLVTTIEVAV